MTLMPFIFSTMFMMGLLGLAIHRKHLLSALLCLESMGLSLFMAFSLWLNKTSTMTFMMTPLILITFSACEAGVGLALLIATVRVYSTDHMQNLNMLHC